MVNDDIMGKFDNRRGERTARKYGFKEPKANSFLIISEGEETEPIYFNSFGQLIKDTIGGNIETVKIPYLTVAGKGRSTMQLLSEVEKIVSKSRIIYQYVWVLFDKDQFDDFDEAINLGIEKGYYVAWSNYCFEYWLTLHFNYSDSALDSNSLQESLSKIYKRLGINGGKYFKNDPNVFENVGGIEGVKKAVRNAKKRMSEFEDNTSPSSFNPGTKVYVLAEKLLSYIEE